jgi:hypothetical protein
MKTIGFAALILATFSAGMTIDIRAGRAEGPWCSIQSANDLGGAKSCGFASFAQCRETAMGIGAVCVQDQLYRPDSGSAGEGRKKTHRPR